MQVWHPWRTLGTHFPHIVVSCDYQLPKGVRGWWRGNTIWLCKTLNQAERRSTLTHELLHVTRGLAPPDLREREERRVDELAARKLIPLPELLHGLQSSTNDDELAEALWTDVHTVRVRRETLTRMEIAWLDEHLDDEVRASSMSGYRGHRADGAVMSSLESDPPPPELIDVVTTSTATRRPRLSPL